MFVCVGVALGVDVPVLVALGVCVTVAVGVAVAVGVSVLVTVALGVMILVAVSVGSVVRDGSSWAMTVGGVGDGSRVGASVGVTWGTPKLHDASNKASIPTTKRYINAAFL